jgi:hypothetical protein
MAPKKSNAAAKNIPSPPLPVPMTSGQRRLYTVGLVVALIALAVGGMGLLILLGTLGKIVLIVSKISQCPSL